MKPTLRAYVVILAGVCAALHVAKISPALPALRLEFGLTELQSGFLISSVQLAGMLLGLLCGSLVELWGLRRSIVSGLLVLFVCSVLGSFSNSAGLLLALRAVEGLSFLWVAMPGPALIRLLATPQEFTKVMGLWGAYMPVGTAISLLVGGLIINWLDWRTWWILLSMLTILCAWNVWHFLPAKPLPASLGANSTKISLRDAVYALKGRLKLTLKSSGPWLVALGFASYGGQWLSIMGFLPSIYASVGITGGIASVMTGSIAAANIIGNVCAGRLLSRGVPGPRLLAMGFITMGICAMIAFGTLDWQGNGLTQVRFGAVMLFSAVGGLIPGTLFSMAVYMAPDKNTITTTVGFMQQLTSTAQFIVPPIAGAIADANSGNWKWTWVVLCVCSLMGLCIARLCASRMPSPSEISASV